jgi:hypothetical protein
MEPGTFAVKCHRGVPRLEEAPDPHLALRRDSVLETTDEVLDFERTYVCLREFKRRFLPKCPMRGSEPSTRTLGVPFKQLQGSCEDSRRPHEAV